MRKIVLILSLIMLMGMSLASAEVRSGTDQFTGGKWVRSGNFLEEQKWIGLRKLINGSTIKYEILFSEKELKNVKFSSNKGEIKIDNKDVGLMVIQEASSRPTFNGDISHISLSALVGFDQIEEFKTAKRVTFKFLKTDGTSSVIVLPDPVLAEWQQVINTEK